MTFPSQDLRDWFAQRQRPLPWRVADARGLRDPYRTWISEIMLQQTRVEAVIPYFEAFLEAFPTVDVLAAAEEEAVLQRWAGLGYYRRARFLHAAARQVVENHEGCFPGNAQELRALPGIGAYTSAAIASLAFGEVVPVVDGNVKRVVSRWAGLELAADAPALEKQVRTMTSVWMESLEEGDLQAPGQWNEALMELGATLCLPRQALCAECPLAQDCQAFATDQVDTLPLPKRAKKWVDLEMVFLVLRVGVRVMLEKREQGWSPGLYEPPSAICAPFETAQESSVAHEATAHELAAEKQTVLGAYHGMVRHTITHHRIRAHVYSIGPTSEGADSPPLQEPEAVPLTGLARKVLVQAQEG